MEQHTGGYARGHVRSSTRGTPAVRFQCQCTDCQKALGGNPTVAARFPAKAFRLDAGRARSNTVRSASGAEVARWFCADCGTPLYITTTRHPDFVHMQFGATDTGPDWPVTTAIWTASAAPWHHIPPHLTRSEQG